MAIRTNPKQVAKPKKVIKAIPVVELTGTEVNANGVQPYCTLVIDQAEFTLMISRKLAQGTPEDRWEASINAGSEWQKARAITNKSFVREYLSIEADQGWWVIQPEKLDDILARAKLMDMEWVLEYAGEYHLIRLTYLFPLYGKEDQAESITTVYGGAT